MNETLNKVILLVEDNEDDVFLMKRALKRAGIKTPLHLARDGETGRRYLSGEAEFADRIQYPFPTLVLLDLKLPYLSGLEFLEWVRSRPDLPSTVIVVVSSSNQPRDSGTAYELGAASYIVKPATPEQLLELARRVKLIN